MLVLQSYIKKKKIYWLNEYVALSELFIVSFISKLFTLSVVVLFVQDATSRGWREVIICRKICDSVWKNYVCVTQCDKITYMWCVNSLGC